MSGMGVLAAAAEENIRAARPKPVFFIIWFVCCMLGKYG